MWHPEDTRADVAIARIAHRQWGVMTWNQLRAAGLAASTISRRVRDGRLHRVHRGVYALIPPSALAPEGRWLAAVLACGDGAVLSHRSAAALWQLIDEGTTRPEVTVPVRGARAVRGVLLHRTRSLPPDSVTSRRGVRVTTVERTLADLAEVVSTSILHRAAQQAEFHRRKVGSSGDPWRHANGRHGAPKLRTLPQLRAQVGMTRSDLERRMLRLCRDARLPEPEANQRIEGECVDFVWRKERLVVETDGGEAHLTAAAFENDRRRDVDLMIAGWRVARFTWAMISYQPARVGERLAVLLGGV
jgi:very-short-patch-repair endonuclease